MKAALLGVPAALVLLAAWQPLPLYLVSLALFGLPHVLWEAAFLRSRYAARWPLRWWLMLWAALLLQAAARTALWLGALSSDAAVIVDLLSLALLGLVLALAPAGAGWLARGAGLLLAGGMYWLLAHGEVLNALLLLAAVHNFTPLAMAWDLAREMAREDPGGRSHAAARRLAWQITLLFALPLLLAGGLWLLPWQPATGTSHAVHGRLLASQWPTTWGSAALLPALVLAQCLHYYCVLVLLPGAERRRTARPLLGPLLRTLALVLAAAISVYFLHDYLAARKLYAVAAGMHAWIEWPVLLLALLGLHGEGARTPLKATPSPSFAGPRP